MDALLVILITGLFVLVVIQIQDRLWKMNDRADNQRPEPRGIPCVPEYTWEWGDHLEPPPVAKVGEGTVEVVSKPKIRPSKRKRPGASSLGSISSNEPAISGFQAASAIALKRSKEKWFSSSTCGD